MLEFSWKTKDGLNIFAKDWPTQKPKAVIALVHGFGEHCSRYHRMAQYYNDKGYAVVGYDRRGHGRSDGKRGHTPSYVAFLDEISTLLVKCSERYPNIPVILYGHSMGGNLVLNYMIERKLNDQIKLAVVTGPWVRLTTEPPKLLILIVKLLKGIFPSLSQNTKLNANYISRVEDEVNKYKNDDLVHGSITLTTAFTMTEWSLKLQEFKGALPIPTLMMHAGDDQLTDPKATEEFYNRVDGDLTFHLWDGLYHEIHNESNREQVFDYTIDWLDNRL